MDMIRDERQDLCESHRRLLQVLREMGPQTLDSLCALPGWHWAQVLLAVDHLSRSRHVAIEMIAPREYQVSLAGGSR